MYILLTILFAASLCADCFAVTLCSSLSLKEVRKETILWIALVFSIIQSGLLILGWAFGDLFVGYVEKLSHIIGFLLLLYVGGSMIIEAVKKESRNINLKGLKNVIIGAVATSIDAFAAGISISMDGNSGRDIREDTAAVFVCTFIAVVAGMSSGKFLGRKFGKAAEITGGAVLICLGLLILFGVNI